MAISQLRSNRKKSGGKYKALKGKVKAYNGRLPALTRIGERKSQTIRVLGGNAKERLLFETAVNVAVDGKIVRDEITTVVENEANRNYVRRNILTRGTIVQLKSGKKARITSRPGQSKIVNAVLVQ